MTKRIPTRLQLNDVATHFGEAVAYDVAARIWGKNISFVRQALNGKKYWLHFVYKEAHREWIQATVAKTDKDGNVIF